MWAQLVKQVWKLFLQLLHAQADFAGSLFPGWF